MNLLVWWRRCVIVERPDPNYDVARVCIDHGDGHTQELYCSRNNLFALAWVCREVVRTETVRGPISQVTMTLRTPISGSGGEEETNVLAVPDWAKSKLFFRIMRLAIAFGWKGECPKPSPTSAFR